LKLTIDDFRKDSASQGIWFYRCISEFTEDGINQILKNQEYAEKWQQVSMGGYTPIKNEICKDWQHYKRIEERLKKRIDYSKRVTELRKGDFNKFLNDELQKILGEKHE